MLMRDGGRGKSDHPLLVAIITAVGGLLITGITAYVTITGRAQANAKPAPPVAISAPALSPSPNVSTVSPVTLAALPRAYITLHNQETGNCFDSMSNGSVFGYACNGGSSQDWSALPVDGAIYALRNRLSGLCLTGSTAGISSAACNTSDPHQKWQWNESVSAASFTHTSDGNCLSEPNAANLPTTSECDGAANQYWRVS